MKKALVMSLLISSFVVAGLCAMVTENPAQGYALHNQHCLGCHDSVADPEKPGFTRDTWFLILNVMHDKYGMKELSADDKAQLVDYLYTIRKGIEREAG